jgi:hypothetical protein
LESTSYGRIFQSFTAPYVFAVTLSFVFTDGDRDKMAQAAAGVFGETRQEFERLFAVWKANWFAGELMYSSDTRDLVKAEGYKELLAMGEDIIPLVIEKLNEEENFPALILYDDLQKDENLVVKYAKNDPPHILMEGEQTRARRTVKLWLNNVK